LANKDLLETQINCLNTSNNSELVQEIEDCLELIASEKSKYKEHEININNKFHAEQTTYQLAIANCKNLYTENLTVARNKLTACETTLREINVAVNNHNIQMANYKKSLESLEKAKLESKLKKDNLTAKITEINQSVIIAQESKRLIKAYTMQIFQESLDYIGEQATQIMSKIPNMSSASIYFEGCKEAKNGNIKDEVNPIVNLDGESEIPFKSLSGGEETSIELAVDLAVIEMIEHKTGKGANFLILDEPFTGLDSANCDKVMDMLISLDTNKHIVIVDHNDIVKAMVNETIIISRTGEESTVIS
jgi:DNA repair exonuclease SbcCD ATPase subunit